MNYFKLTGIYLCTKLNGAYFVLLHCDYPLRLEHFMSPAKFVLFNKLWLSKPWLRMMYTGSASIV